MMSGDISSTLNHIEPTLSSLHKDVDALTEGRERNTGAKFPQRVSSDLPMLTNEDDEVTPGLSWAERMEFKPGEAGDRIHPVKMEEATKTILQGPSPLEECRQADAKVSVSSSCDSHQYGTQA